MEWRVWWVLACESVDIRGNRAMSDILGRRGGKRKRGKGGRGSEGAVYVVWVSVLPDEFQV